MSTSIFGVMRVLLVVIGFTSSVVMGDEENRLTVGFSSVEAAYEALSTDPSATLTEYEGWVIYNQKQDGKYILWSFTPVYHPAYPSVVKREIVKRGETLLIGMSALCESPKEACDGLIDDFKAINENLKKKHSGG